MKWMEERFMPVILKKLNGGGLVDSIKAAIAKTLLAIAKKYEKGYCYPSQRHILRLLRQRQWIDISLRTLNRYLKEMEEEGYFSRVRRLRCGQGGKIVFCSTLYKLGGKLFNWVYKEVSWGKRLFSFFRLPKMAQYETHRVRYPSVVDKLPPSVEEFISKRYDAPILQRA